MFELIFQITLKHAIFDTPIGGLVWWFAGSASRLPSTKPGGSNPQTTNERQPDRRSTQANKSDNPDTSKSETATLL